MGRHSYPLSCAVLALAMAAAPVDGADKAPRAGAPKASLGRGSPALAQPDLVIVRIATDRHCELVLTVRNRGPGAIPSKALGKTKVRVVAAGSARSLSLSGKAADKALARPGGTAMLPLGVTMAAKGRVEATVDSGNAVLESDETNNTFRTVVQPRCKPAKAPEAIAAKPPARPRHAQPLAKPERPAHEKLRRSETSVQSTRTPGLGRSINPSSEVAGTRETVYSDLVVEQVTLSHTAVEVAQSFTVSFQVRNQGATRLARVPFRIEAKSWDTGEYADYTALETGSFDDLAPGDARQLSVLAAFPRGYDIKQNNEIQVSAGSFGTPERSYVDNFGRASITVVPEPLPDLRGVRLRIAAEPDPYNTLWSVGIRNTGTARAPPFVYVVTVWEEFEFVGESYYPVDPRETSTAATFEAPELVPGQTLLRNVPVPRPSVPEDFAPASVRATLSIDSTDAVRESSELNNGFRSGTVPLD